MITADLRSDTVTKPTPKMLAFMMQAEVGDDVFGENPSVYALEKKKFNLCKIKRKYRAYSIQLDYLSSSLNFFSYRLQFALSIFPRSLGGSLLLLCIII